MAAQTKKVDIAAVMGGSIADMEAMHQKHKTDTTTGRQTMPPGISRGITDLYDVRFAVYENGDNRGKPYVMISTVADSPETHKGVRVKGQRLNFMFNLFDTLDKKTLDGEPRSKEINYSEFMATMRGSYGVVTKDIAKFTDWERVFAALLAKKPRPRSFFSTREGKPRNPGETPPVFAELTGECKEVKVVDQAAAFTQTPPLNGVHPTAEVAVAGGEVVEANGHSEGESGTVQTGDIDYAATVAQADQGDMSAIATLTDTARAAGWTDEEIEAATWAEVAEMCQNAKEPEPEVATKTPEPEESVPKVKETFNYTFKAGGKPKQVKVDKVDKKAKTVDLTDLTDKAKKYQAVPWSKLSPI